MIVLGLTHDQATSVLCALEQWSEDHGDDTIDVIISVIQDKLDNE